MVVCENCSAVYDAEVTHCDPCGGWDMRKVKCAECGKRQQYGFGWCVSCGGPLGGGHGDSRKGCIQVDAELQEIKSFTFNDVSNYKRIDELRQIQKEEGHDLNWTYDTYKELDA